MTGPTITGRLTRRTAGRRTRPTMTTATPFPTPADALPTPPRPRRPPGPARVARMLALAYHVEARIDAGELRDHADAARRLGITRARMSQVAALAYLPIAVQEAILAGTSTATERQLRARATMVGLP